MIFFIVYHLFSKIYAGYGLTGTCSATGAGADRFRLVLTSAGADWNRGEIARKPLHFFYTIFSIKGYFYLGISHFLTQFSIFLSQKQNLETEYARTNELAFQINHLKNQETNFYLQIDKLNSVIVDLENQNKW